MPVKWGVYISEISQSSPAYKGGLRVGDIVNQIAEEEINGKNPFINILLKHKPGEKVKVKYYRDDDERSASIVLGKAER